MSPWAAAILKPMGTFKGNALSPSAPYFARRFTMLERRRHIRVYPKTLSARRRQRGFRQSLRVCLISLADRVGSSRAEGKADRRGDNNRRGGPTRPSARIDPTLWDVPALAEYRVTRRQRLLSPSSSFLVFGQSRGVAATRLMRQTLSAKAWHPTHRHLWIRSLRRRGFHRMVFDRPRPGVHPRSARNAA